MRIKNRKSTGKVIAHTLLSLLVICSLALPPKQANACLWCSLMVALYTPMIWGKAISDYDQHVNNRFIELEQFIVTEMWAKSILPALMLSAEQFTVIAMRQVMAIGMFLDAKHQLETQQLLQVLQAKAHKDYHPSEGMCQFGSAMKALAASDMRSDYTAFVLSQRSQDRQLGNMFSSGAYGNDLDKNYRIAQFRQKFCNEKDRDSSLDPDSATVIDNLCYDPADDAAVAVDDPAKTAFSMEWDTMKPEQRFKINRDIDFFTLVDSPWTMRVDFTNTKIIDGKSDPKVYNQEEEDIFALSSNLFASELFIRPSSKSIESILNQPLTSMQQAFMDMRSIVAKRSVAENSFIALAASKAEGTTAMDWQGDQILAGKTPKPARSRLYLQNIVRNLGVSTADALSILGENPSYNAQMEVLTKKIFQSPDFFTNLYDKPTNIKRKEVTLQAIRMMQKFDMLKSVLRSEASFSVLLELAVSDLQKEIEMQINTIDVSERRE